MGLSTKERVLFYAQEGMGPTDIAHKVGITRQRVYQILRNPEKDPKKNPTKKKLGRKPYINDETEIQVKNILSTRDSWTWLEAEEALSNHGLRFPAMKIFDWLRELGFQKKTRNDSTWRKK